MSINVQVVLSTIIITIVSAVHYNDMLQGTYEFEIMGRPYKLYLCDSSNPSEKRRGLHWAIADTTHNEYTIAVGRDSTGVEFDGNNEYVAECEIFRLFGDKHLKGVYKVVFNMVDYTWRLYERFPDFMHSNVAWNTYKLIRVSPRIVSNPAIRGYQCFEPDPNVVLNGTTLWRSRYLRDVRGYHYALLSDKEGDCWRRENRYGTVQESGYLFGTQVEWDGTLLMTQWDNPLRPSVCALGSQFLIAVSDRIALLTMQCEDRITGYQYLLYLDQSTREQMTCPFEVDRYRGHSSSARASRRYIY